MHAIILFSHGSTLCGAGENLKHLAERMEARGDAPIVEVGYLNYSEPAFEDAFATCVQRGATHITIAPYFLVAGYFVNVSLPPKITVMAEQFPHVPVKVAEALKQHTLLAEALVACAERAAPPAQWRNLLNTAPRFCRDNEACPLHGTEKCPATFIPGAKAPGYGNGSPSGAETRAGLEVSTAPLGASVPVARCFSAGEGDSLLVMVHGSPRPESNLDMFAVVEEVKARSLFPIVEVAFMECNEPSIPEGIETCVARGARRVIAVPYFLHAGTHVADDLPTLLEEAQAKHPDVEFLMGDFIGHDELLADVIAERVHMA